MPKHVLPRGRSVIAAIARLGEALGYAVEEEHPVESGRANPPAVDIAWFSGAADRYPLMIFEVESRATSGIANNALKVFGQDTSRFEKPLFFFHVILHASDTTRLETLQRVFGTYNYRHFSFSEVAAVDLLEAVLGQHRRVRDRVDLDPLLKCLDLDGWRGVSPSDVVRAVRANSFEADYVPALAIASTRDPSALDAFIQWLIEDAHSTIRQRPDCDYETYLGYGWSEPLHFGLIAAARPDLVADMQASFRRWQSGRDGWRQIAPHFGLSREYDEFLIGGAPGLLSIVVALMPGLTDDVLSILSEIRAAMAPWAGIPNAMWASHIAAAFNRIEAYEDARGHLNDWGGVNRARLLAPSVLYDLSGDETWPDEVAADALIAPSITEFTAAVEAQDSPAATPEQATAIALRLLTDWSYGAEPVPELVRALRLAGQREHP